METQPQLLLLWGKTDPFHPLVCHMIDVGRTALALLGSPSFSAVRRRLTLATQAADEASLVAWASYLAALHDIGKCHADFQGKGPAELVAPLEGSGLCCTVQDKGYRHDAFAWEWLHTHLQTQWEWDRSASKTTADAIGGHHGFFFHDPPMLETPAQKASWSSLRDQLACVAAEVFDPSPRPARFLDHSVAGVLLSGVVVLADWIASNPELFPARWQGESLEKYKEMSGAQARVAVERIGFAVGWPFHSGMRFDEVWPQYVPRPVQHCCEEIGRAESPPGLVIVEAPMGEGKTEAALHLAAQWGSVAGLCGVYMALPTAATSNQMHGRMREFLGMHNLNAAHGLRLIHGMAWVLDEETPTLAPQLSGEVELALDWFRPKRRALLAAFGVGTVDQALMSALAVRHGFLRLFGLAGKTLVIDEVHAYDSYMTEILTRLLKWCAALQVPVLLLSATLPAARRRSLADAYQKGAGDRLQQVGEDAPYPLVTVVAKEDHVREVGVTPSDRITEVRLLRHDGFLTDLGATVDAIVAQLARGGGCRVAILNTVREAQAVYQAVQERVREDGLAPVELLLFHSRFRAARRQQVETQTLRLFDRRSTLPDGHPERTERPPSALLVATQVVEQSLDLDFDEMFSQLAPTDLLLQRVGRLHRHERGSRPTGPEVRLHLLLPGAEVEFGGTGWVYDRYVLLRTLLALDGKDCWRLPGDIRCLVEATYADDLSAGSVPDGWSDMLEQARVAYEQRLAEDARKARMYLIPDPDPRRFGLADPPLEGPFDEAEGNAASYFAARTRLGNETISVILLEGEVYREALGGPQLPPKKTIRALLLESVSLPRFWFKDCEPEKRFEALAPAPSWLPGYWVLRLKNSLWRGVDHKDRPITIRDHTDLGVLREEGGD